MALASIMWAWLFVGQPAPHKIAAPPRTTPIVNEATLRGQDPWMTNEPYIESARESQREGALKALTQPWSILCTEEGRNRLASALSEYWYHRSVQTSGYPASWGETARPYIIKAWSTPEDIRIDQLVRQAYRNGYLNLADIRPHTREAMAAAVLRDERVAGTPCAAKGAVAAR